MSRQTDDFRYCLDTGSFFIFLFPRATSQADMLACPFGNCREGLIPRCLHHCQFDAPYACIGVFAKKTAVFRGSGSLQFPSILLFYASLLTQDQLCRSAYTGVIAQSSQTDRRLLTGSKSIIPIIFLNTIDQRLSCS